MSRTIVAILFLLVVETTFFFGCAAPSETETSAYAGEDVPILCRDGDDNDGDGLIDCDDPDCQPLYTCKNDETDTAQDTAEDTEVVTDWIRIATADFIMGRNDGDPSEAPEHVVYVTHLELMRTEVTETQFQACVDASACQSLSPSSHCASEEYRAIVDEDPDRFPMNCLSWDQAKTFCEWVGGRLPSEAEWEYAASGGMSEHDYPWGDEPTNCELAVINDGDSDGTGCGLSRPWPVCSKEAGISTWGGCDVIGNVREWVEDDVHKDYTDAPSKKDPWIDDPRTPGRMVRGGAYYDSAETSSFTRFRCDPEDGCGISDEMDGYGVRCARDF